jgi:glycosyltransferase involved in cell wall biosynthesis
MYQIQKASRLMRIGMIIDNTQEFPPDIRVEKEIKALVAAGHEVFVLSPKYKSDSVASEFMPKLGATVDRVVLGAVAGRYLANAWRAITMFDTRWLEVTRNFVDRHQLEVLHVHDLFTVPAIVQVGKEKGIPVVADLHENMPAAMRAERSTYPLWKRILMGTLYNYHWMQRNEARTLKKCAAVVIVVPEAAERLLSYGISESQIHVISNTEDETTFQFKPEQADFSIREQYKDKFVISYIGGFGVHRGLDTTLKAIPLIIPKVPNIHFLIVGADPKSKEIIDNMISVLKIGAYVEVLSWQPFHKVNSYVMASDVCLVPHNDFEHTQTTIPHKLFQYMICGKPVLVSDCKPLKRIVEISNSGRIFKANDFKHMAIVIEEMYRNREELTEYGKNGQYMALNQFSWKNEAAKLIKLYESIEISYDKRQKK